MQTDYFKRDLLEADLFSDNRTLSLITAFRTPQCEAIQAGHTFTDRLREITERQAILRQFCAVSELLFLGEALIGYNIPFLSFQLSFTRAPRFSSKLQAPETANRMQSLLWELGIYIVAIEHLMLQGIQ